MKVATLAAAITMASSGLALAQDYRYNDRDDDYRYDRDRDFSRSGFRAARDFGFEDGRRTALEDEARGKPYQPYPRHNSEDHGYRREYGDKNDYRAAYAQAYQAGYEREFRRY